MSGLPRYLVHDGRVYELVREVEVRDAYPPCCDRERGRALLWWEARPLWLRAVVVFGALLAALLALGWVARM